MIFPFFDRPRTAHDGNRYIMLWDPTLGHAAGQSRVITYDSLNDLANNIQASNVAGSFDYNTEVRGLAHDGDRFIMLYDPNTAGGNSRVITYNSLTDLVSNTQATNVAGGFDYNDGVQGLAHDGIEFTLIWDPTLANGNNQIITYNNLGDLLTNTQSSNLPGSFDFNTELRSLAGVVVLVPETSSAVLGAIGLIGLVSSRRREKR